MLWNKSMVAIDIGSSAIKVVDSSGLGRNILKFGMASLPPGSVVEGVIQNADEVNLALKRALQNAGISTTFRRASVSISGGSAIIKKINYPANGDHDSLSELVFHEAEQHFQFDISELYFDYKILPTKESSLNTTILLAGAKRDQVDQMIKIVKSTGLKIGVIDCDVFSLMNMMESHYGLINQLIALVDIGDSTTKIVFILGGEYLYTRVIPLGGNSYTEEISKEMGVSNKEAIKIKHASSDDLSVDPQILKSITKITEQLTYELNTTIEFFLQSDECPEGHTRLQGVGLTGGGVQIYGLEKTLKNDLKCEVKTLNPFAKSLVSDDIKNKIKKYSNLLGVLSGLSSRKFEFVP